MKVRLNVATKALQTHRQFLLLSGLVGTFGLVFFIALGWHVYSVRKADEILRVKLDTTRREVMQLEKQRDEMSSFFALPENAKLHERSAFLNTIIDQQSLNWTGMFMDLEKLLPGGVRVMSIEPNLTKGRVEVKLTIGATGDDTKLKFIQALEKSPAFKNVQLLGEKAIVPGQNTGPDRTVVELHAEYQRS